MASRARGSKAQASSSHVVPEAPDWKRVEELHDKLGYHDTTSATCCKPGSLLLGVVQVLLFLCVGAAAVWTKLSFLSLLFIMRPQGHDGKDPTKRQEAQRPIAFAALCLAIFCPYVWNLIWKVWRTPLFNHPQHMWPRGVQLVFIILTAILESAGITIFVLIVCPNIPPLLALGMMCLVFCLPRGHVLKGITRCFRRNQPYQPLVNVHIDGGMSAFADTMHVPRSRFEQKRDTGRILSLLGCFVQWLGLIAVPLLAVVFDDTGIKENKLLVAICGPLSILLLAFAWWPVLHAKIGLSSAPNKLGPQQLQRSASVNAPRTSTPVSSGTSRRGNARFLSMADTEPPADHGPVRRIKPSSALRGSVISLLLRCIFSGVAIYIISVYFRQDCAPQNDKCTFWEDFGKIGKYDNHNVLYCLLGLLLCSFVAYHGARYSMMMGLQWAGFAIPFSITPLVSAGVVVLISGHTHTMHHAHLTFATEHKNWWHYGLFILCATLSMWMSNKAYTFARRIPRLALDETLFYQHAYNALFVDQFALISRRSSTKDEAEDDGDTKFVRSTEEVLEDSRIFVCTTMYNESENEMEQLLESVINSGVYLAKSCKFESHIFMDGGMQGDNEPGYKALQLLRVLKRTIQQCLKEQSTSVSWQRMKTPYGARVQFDIDGLFTINVHLKDASLVRKGKRWSQVMYMFFLTRYVLDFVNNGDSDNAYILATDADIKFTPHDVIALLMMISRDRSVGAVCGRTYPLGGGPLVWYQHFDYAIGHWFQKAAEHVLGSVLCCPGCFSLFRIDALREVVLEYSTHVDQAFDFLTKDMGEDRWLCTLLVTRGWRLEYCAAAKDRTFCPDNLKTFFKQRRRWIVSTVANMVQILSLGRVAVRRNPSVSYAYIAYTGLMLVSTVVSPATVLLVMIGGFNYVLGWDLVVVETILFATTLFYLLVCMLGSQDSQFLLAKILTGVFAIIMGLVFVGLLAQIADDISTATTHNSTSSNPSPHPHPPSPSPPKPPPLLNDGLDNVNDTVFNVTWSLLASASDAGSNNLRSNHHVGVGSGDGDISMSSVYLLTMVGMFFVAGFLHLGEFTDLVHGVWYLLCLPTGYLFLLIYACCNLNDRSWGTRTGQPDGQGPGGASGVRPTSWWELLLYGCGREPKESLIHFLGRIMCCRRYDQVPDVDVEEEKIAMKKTEYVPLTWRLVPEIGTTEDIEYHVECIPVTKAIELLRTPAKDREELLAAMKAAVMACPMLVERAAVRSAAWHAAWNSELMKLEASFVETVLQQQEAAHAMAEDLEHTMQELTERFQEEQLDAPTCARSHLTSIAAHEETRFAHFQLVHDWVGQFNSADEEHLVDRLLDNGYENTITLSYLEINDLRAMGIDQLPSGDVLVHRIMAEVKKLKDKRPPYRPAERLDMWLESLGLGQYWPHFHFFDFKPDDVNSHDIMKSLNEQRLQEMGVVKLGHLRRLSHALKALQKRLNDAKDHKQAVKQSKEDDSKKIWEIEEEPLSDDEKAFWHGVIQNVLSPRGGGGIQEDSLKTKLDDLRNRSVLAMVIINTMWLLFMLVLNGAVAQHLRILGTNPLGVMFILTYGALFALQFLTMLVHRFDTFLQFMATISVDRFIDSKRQTPSREMSDFSDRL